MTFAAMLLDIYRRLDVSSAPPTDTITRIKAFVNDAYQEILGEPGLAEWIAANNPAQTFASVSGQWMYAVPTAIERIDTISERTNRRRLSSKSWDWYRSTQPDPTTNTGTPSDYIAFGFQPVAVQPSAATGLWAVSTAAGDTTQTVYVETMRSGGIPYSASLTLNGTTRVQLGALTDHVEVTKYYVSAVGVGDIRLYDAATNGNLLGTIYIGTTFARYFGFALWPTPAAALTYYLEGPRVVPDLVNDTDEPAFPARFHRILIEGALRREFEKRDDDTRLIRAEQRRKAILSGLRYFLTCPPDFLPTAGRMRATAPSRLGGYFPNGAGVR